MMIKKFKSLTGTFNYMQQFIYAQPERVVKL